jgi:Cu+-exporting ATPase
MKRIFLMLVLSLALLACSETKQDQGAQLKTAEINVPTLQCNKCVAHVEEALKGVDGVSEAKVNLSTKIAHVSFDATKTNLAAMEKAIAGAGYDANDTQSDPSAYAALESCCKVPGARGSN